MSEATDNVRDLLRGMCFAGGAHPDLAAAVPAMQSVLDGPDELIADAIVAGAALGSLGAEGIELSLNITKKDESNSVQ